MREEPLRMLAGAVASALAKAVDTDLWADLRARVAAVLAPTLFDLVSAHLDEARGRVVGAPAVRLELARAEFTTEWRGSIHTMLWQHPEAAGPLRAVLHAVSPALPRVAGESGVVQHSGAHHSGAHHSGAHHSGTHHSGARDPGVHPAGWPAGFR
ncbi:hypothetical protein [Saccharothrix espanaensis]|uniref:hypothetical protein n=1 Tax=Saccharothrix espanaensis TaxID=103731 RepID=UPI0002E30932|nr:hypothetical protein [Saccharothrix espanaensis]